MSADNAEIPQPTGEAAPLPVVADVTAPLAPPWNGRVRCGFCGHERTVDASSAMMMPGGERRWPCLAGCFRVGDGDQAVPRLSCYALLPANGG